MIEFKSFASSSKGNLYTVSDGETRIMIECGLPWRDTKRALDFKTSSIYAILCSHAHLDHSRGAGKAMKAGIDFYTSNETIMALGLSGHRVHAIKPLQQFRLNTWQVLPFSVPHDVDNLGFLLANEKGERFLFAIDCVYIPYRFRSLHTIAVGVNYSMDILRGNISNGLTDRAMKTRLIRSHMSLQTLESFLVANDLSQVRKIYLLHLSDSNSDAKLFKLKVQEVTGKEVIV